MSQKDNIFNTLDSHPDISAFLSQYPRKYHKEVLFNVVLHGIYSLQSLYPSSVPMAKIKQQMEDSLIKVKAETLIPSIHQKLGLMKKAIESIEDNLNAKPLPENLKPKYSGIIRSRPAAVKVTAINSQIYPHWWLNMCSAEKPERTWNSVKKVDFWSQTDKRLTKRNKWATAGYKHSQVLRESISSDSPVVYSYHKKTPVSVPMKRKQAWAHDYSAVVKHVLDRDSYVSAKSISEPVLVVSEEDSNEVYRSPTKMSVSHNESARVKSTPGKMLKRRPIESSDYSSSGDLSPPKARNYYRYRDY